MWHIEPLPLPAHGDHSPFVRTGKPPAIAGSVLVTLWIVCASTGISSADPIQWELDGFVFEDGGTASGFFVTEGSDTLLDWSITVSGGGEGTFPPITYSQTNSTGAIFVVVVPEIPPVVVPLVRLALAGDRTLTIVAESFFSRPGVLSAGATEAVDPISRGSTASGSLVGVPEPGTAVLLGLGIGMMASKRRLDWR